MEAYIQDIRFIRLYKLRYIGDVLLTTPAIRLIRQSYPDAHITMVVNSGTKDVIRYNPHIDNIITIDRRMIEDAGLYSRLQYEWNMVKALRAQPCDLSVDFDSGERAAFLSLLSNTRIRIGLRHPKGIRKLIFNRQVRINGRTHTVERNLMLVEQAFNLSRTDTMLELYTSSEEEDYIDSWLHSNGLLHKEYVVVHPGARYWFKRWSNEKWAGTIDLIQRELCIPVIISGGQKESDDVSAISSLMTTPVYSIAGRTGILDLAALLKKAALFIGNDSGPAHIAAASGTKVIALFGPTSPEVWRPWGDDHTVIYSQFDCSPCGRIHCDRGTESCMEKISISQVFSAVSRRLAGRARSNIMSKYLSVSV